jgi:hypothetical protein
MNSNKIIFSAIPAAKKAAQAAQKQLKQESFETLKSAKTQFGFSTENVARSQEKIPTVLQNIRSQGPENVDPAEIKKNEQMLLNTWRQKLNQIIEEQNRERQKQAQTLADWRASQEEAMQKDKDEDQSSGLIMPKSKPRRGLFRGIKAKIQEKMTSRETGRGAKS